MSRAITFHRLKWRLFHPIVLSICCTFLSNFSKYFQCFLIRLICCNFLGIFPQLLHSVCCKYLTLVSLHTCLSQFTNFILLFSSFLKISFCYFHLFSFCEIHFFQYLRRMKFSVVHFLYISFVVWHTSFAHFGIIYKLLNRFCEWKK